MTLYVRLNFCTIFFDGNKITSTTFLKQNNYHVQITLFRSSIVNVENIKVLTEEVDITSHLVFDCINTSYYETYFNAFADGL